MKKRVDPLQLEFDFEPIKPKPKEKLGGTDYSLFYQVTKRPKNSYFCVVPLCSNYSQHSSGRCTTHRKERCFNCLREFIWNETPEYPHPRCTKCRKLKSLTSDRLE